MAAIFNSVMLDSATALLDSDTLLSSLRFTQKHSYSTLTLTQTNSIWLKLIQSHSFSLNLVMAAILNSAFMNLALLDSAILVFPLKLTHTCKDGFPPFAQINFTHSFSPNLMMAAILNCVILDSAILVFPLKLTLAKIGSHHLHKKNFTHTSFPTICTKKLHSFILT